jgi:histidinol-phosphatase (PHP family)
VLGHLDLVKRYTQRYMNAFDITSHADLVDHILETCLESQLVPELNMSSLRQGIDEPMPADWVVRRYVELGGTAMSLGSDAHISEHIGQRVPEGAKMLQNQGINALAVFREGQRCDELIS